MLTLNISSLQKRLLQDESLVLMVLQQYRRDLPAHVAALREALEAGDVGEVAKKAHKMKGAAGNVGAERLAEMTGAAERAALAGNRAALTTLMAEIENHLPALEEAASTVITASSAPPGTEADSGQ